MRTWPLVFTLLLLAAAPIPEGDREPPTETAVWLADLRASHRLAANEITAGVPRHIGAVFFGGTDPRKAVEELRTKPDDARAEVREMARIVSPKPRPATPGVQPDARASLVWWDTAAKTVKRSTDRTSTFDPKTDRLLAALVILDNAGLSTGRWVVRDKRETLPVPAAWDKSKGVTKFHERSPAPGVSLAAPSDIASGAFAAEDESWVAVRGYIETSIAKWAMKRDRDGNCVNRGDRIALLVVYGYADATSRAADSFRLYAFSASGKLRVQTVGYTEKGDKPVIGAELREWGTE